MRTSNPALSDRFFAAGYSGTGKGVMTAGGVANKTLILLSLLVFSASWVWSNPLRFMPLLYPSLFIGFVVAMLTMFKSRWASITGPIYALVEGVVIGILSAIFERSYPGIVIQAVMLTFGTLFCLLLIYKSGMIKVTDNFRRGVIAATGAIALVYIVSMIMGFFGRALPFIYDSGPVGIGFSLLVVAIAAFNLVLDFDFIAQGARRGLDKSMEWYGAFALMVTLIWLYMEILRLLAKTRRR